jgi:hypothetical protein
MNTTPSPEPNPDDGHAATISQLVVLHARLDALNAIVEVLTSKQQMPLDVVRDTQQKIYAASLQKRLEQIEGLSPEAAARIDQRGDMPSIDPDLMKHLKFGWNGES